jgi:hypothetical protein
VLCGRGFTADARGVEIEPEAVLAAGTGFAGVAAGAALGAGDGVAGFLAIAKSNGEEVLSVLATCTHSLVRSGQLEHEESIAAG